MQFALIVCLVTRPFPPQTMVATQANNNMDHVIPTPCSRPVEWTKRRRTRYRHPNTSARTPPGPRASGALMGHSQAPRATTYTRIHVKYIAFSAPVGPARTPLKRLKWALSGAQRRPPPSPRPRHPPHHRPRPPRRRRRPLRRPCRLHTLLNPAPPPLPTRLAAKAAQRPRRTRRSSRRSARQPPPRRGTCTLAPAMAWVGVRGCGCGWICV